jgi:TonB family protein
MMSRYHLFSFIFHGIFFLCVVMILKPLIPTQSLGQPQIEMIRAYMQTEVIKPPVITRDSAKLQIKKSILSVTHTQSIVKKTKYNPFKKAQLKQIARGEDVNELLRLLHHVIQEVQRYPASAQAMGREGRATVSFKLLLSGAVTNVILEKSSGVASLDQAAIEAVNHAAPFRNVDCYLSEPRSFKIDVVFALT